MSASCDRNCLAAQNDAFRHGSPSIQGQRVHTRGIEAFGAEVVESIWATVRAFDRFTPENDTYGEHDFGSFEHPVAGSIFWKIDYYDLDLNYGAENLSDAAGTRRILTVMLASEY
jgi:hypothetical protein